MLRTSLIVAAAASIALSAGAGPNRRARDRSDPGLGVDRAIRIHLNVNPQGLPAQHVDYISVG
jgi:hypothetical protein